MKTFTTILLLAAFIFFKSTSPAADVVQKAPSSLELVLIDDHVVFSTATNISMEMNVPSALGFCLPTTIQDWTVVCSGLVLRRMFALGLVVPSPPRLC